MTTDELQSQIALGETASASSSRTWPTPMRWPLRWRRLPIPRAWRMMALRAGFVADGWCVGPQW